MFLHLLVTSVLQHLILSQSFRQLWTSLKPAGTPVPGILKGLLKSLMNHGDRDSAPISHLVSHQCI